MVELMITLVIAAVLLTLATPAFIDLIANNRLRSEVYALRGLLTEARSEALTERNNVTVCSSNDGQTCSGSWNDGYIAFFDTNTDDTVNGDDRIILVRTPNAKGIDISFSHDDDKIVYNSRGNAQTPGEIYNGTFTLCDSRGEEKAVGLIVSPVGTLAAALDRDDDGIVNDHEGNNLACDD